MGHGARRNNRLEATGRKIGLPRECRDQAGADLGERTTDDAGEPSRLGPRGCLQEGLWAAGARGYRVNACPPGRPDIVFPARRLAIFVNGCFWHLCPVCNLPRPRGNADFWKNKLEANRARDARGASAARCAWLGGGGRLGARDPSRPSSSSQTVGRPALRPRGSITEGGLGRTEVDTPSPPSDFSCARARM